MESDWKRYLDSAVKAKFPFGARIDEKYLVHQQFLSPKRKRVLGTSIVLLYLSIFGSFIYDIKINCFPSARLDVQVVDVGPPANWVKINVREKNDSFLVYALVPGLLRDEVQSDPAGRLVITGQPNQLSNLWGVTGFKKVITLPSRIDQLRTNIVVSLHGCLHVHVPFVQQNF
ncbi:hypothetical protein H5410_061630 [Solanum commersonii]|uniref:SHSP domain-containing protein n=1 Tax=Solanum commersonii TaxID=4109 RepID=A0A9J5W9S2_SOLCO|nr:hypothetical protein H5410_061630 [Solanum commersonii]